MAKMSITFPGFADLAEQLDRMEGNLLKTAANEALEDTEKIVQDKVKTAAAPYAHKGGGRKGYATGKMFNTIKRPEAPQWSGNIATVGVGFSSENMAGFMHSIFVMYGTPRMKKDTKVYNAIKGKATLNEIAEKQEEVMRKYLSLGGKK